MVDSSLFILLSVLETRTLSRYRKKEAIVKGLSIASFTQHNIRIPLRGPRGL